MMFLFAAGEKWCSRAPQAGVWGWEFGIVVLTLLNFLSQNIYQFPLPPLANYLFFAVVGGNYFSVGGIWGVSNG